VMDQTEDGRRLKLLPIVDEYSRECLTIEVERRFTGRDIVRILARLFKQRGRPEYLRSDNGPEFIADVVKNCLRDNGVKTLYIEPGSPWENGYGESFNGKLRDELLRREIFRGIKEAKYLVKEYVEEYNQRRPHSALGYATPAAFASGQMGVGGRGA